MRRAVIPSSLSYTSLKFVYMACEALGDCSCCLVTEARLGLGLERGKVAAMERAQTPVEQVR